MRKIIQIFLFLFFAAAQVSAQNIPSETLAPKPDETPQINISQKDKEEAARRYQNKISHVWRAYEGGVLPENEKLTFNVMWQFITVGEATLEIRGLDDIEGRRAYHIYSYAKTKPFFDEFFKVRDVNESWLDKESMSSLKYSSDISEGKYKKRDALEFDQIEKTFRYYHNDRAQMGEIPPYIVDVLCALYYMRTLEIKTGKQYEIFAHAQDDSWPLIVKVLRKEKIKTPAGQFKCFVVEPIIKKGAGIANVEGQMHVWLTDDERKLPVYLKTKVPIGSAIATLSKIE